MSDQVKIGIPWLLLSFFGVFGALLLAVGRWEIAATRNYGNVPLYYSIFLYPFFIGLIGLLFVQVKGAKIARTLAIAVSLIVLITSIKSFPRFKGQFVEMSKWHLAARTGSQNWSLMHTARLSGDMGFAYQYLFGVIKDLKSWGKYKELTQDFINDPTEFAMQEGLENLSVITDESSCNSGKIFSVENDRRSEWRMSHEPNIWFVRTYGYALNPNSCSGRADFVFLMDTEGKILCVSRPNVGTWDLSPKDIENLKNYKESVFDFSCPILEPNKIENKYKVYSYTRNPRKIVLLK